MYVYFINLPQTRQEGREEGKREGGKGGRKSLNVCVHAVTCKSTFILKRDNLCKHFRLCANHYFLDLKDFPTSVPPALNIFFIKLEKTMEGGFQCTSILHLQPAPVGRSNGAQSVRCYFSFFNSK